MKFSKRSIFLLVPVLILLLSFSSVWAAPKGKVTIAVPYDMPMDVFNFKSGVTDVPHVAWSSVVGFCIVIPRAML